MSTVDIYIHGTPRGHQIWGSGSNHDYISIFYNHDSEAKEPAVLQADICGGDSFYTYIRSKKVFDAGGRPGAFFALTVSFKKAYCTNVYMLYQLFEAVYNQLCVGSIIAKDGTTEKFLVDDFTNARSGTSATVDKIQAAFSQKIEELIVPSLMELTSGDTINRPKKTVSLLEVDSPLFFDWFKKHSLIVSPNTQPLALSYEGVVRELKEANASKKVLTEDNAKLQSDLDTITRKNDELSQELQLLSSSIGKKNSGKVDQLQQELDKVTEERDSLKTRIAEAANSIDMIDKPIKTLARLLAGRFPKDDCSEVKENNENTPKVLKTSLRTIWRDRLNSILLGAIFILSVFVLFFVLDNRHSDVVVKETPNKIAETELETDTANYADRDICRIDIEDGGDIVEKGKEYSLRVCPKETFPSGVKIPAGVWKVEVETDHPFNDGDRFTVPSELNSGTNIQIMYQVADSVYLSRVITIE